MGLTGSERARVMNGEVRAGEAVTVTRRSNMVYNGWGLAVGQTETLREVSTTLDHNRSTVRSQITHNDLHQMTGFRDEVRDDSAPGVIETTTLSGAQYNGNGRMVFSHEVKQQTGLLESRVETDRWVTHDREGRAKTERTVARSDSGLVVEKERVILAYNGFGQSKGETIDTIQRGHLADGSVTYEITSRTQKTDLTYDDRGRAVGHVEREESSDKPGLASTKTWTSSGYNTNDQLLGSVEVKKEESAAGVHEVTTVLPLIHI